MSTKPEDSASPRLSTTLFRSANIPQKIVAGLMPPIRKSEWIWLLISILALTIARLPMLLHAAGQMDEQWFAVPGLTVAKEGIPRIPYCPTRRRETFFENADKCVFALPPALHYVQAPFFMLMKPGYPAARMPLFLCGIVGLGILWLIARQFIDEPWMVGISLVMFAVSRPLMFTSVTARPDLLCAVFGWLVLLTMLHWTRAPKHGWLVVAGGLCGIGLLCHPFALVYCIQAGVWSVLASGALQVRIGRAIVLSVSALLMLGLWLPLILAFPYEFQSQFFCNVLERSGPGILSRMIWPWDSFDRHWKQQCEFNEVFQMAFLMSGLLGGTAISLFRKRGSAGFFYTCLAWTAVYFTATAAGIHPTKGYWVYAIGLIYPFAVLGHVQLLQLLNDIAIRLFTISPALRTSEETQLWYRGHSVRIALFSAGLLAIMLPHSGIKATFCYLQNWGDGRYHAGKFIAEVLERLPQEGLFMVDVNYVLDVYLTGRKTILCQPRTRFWGEEELGINYLIVGQEGLDGDWPNQYETTFFRREGNRSTEFDCFVEIYVPKPSPESPPRLD